LNTYKGRKSIMLVVFYTSTRKYLYCDFMSCLLFVVCFSVLLLGASVLAHLSHPTPHTNPK
jgi:hypothetical protein